MVEARGKECNQFYGGAGFHNGAGDYGFVEDDDLIVANVGDQLFRSGRGVNGQIAQGAQIVPAQIAGVGALAVENDNFPGFHGILLTRVVSNTKAKNARILELDSLQAVTAQQVADGVTYLSVMEQNLEVLKTALGG